VLVAGFLGAGKTSLILSAAVQLERSGVRCAVVLNDQGEELVDTLHVRQREIVSSEVTGGCFCCKFSDFVSVIEQLRAVAPEVIFAEPVGSCVDIAATVIRPSAGGVRALPARAHHGARRSQARGIRTFRWRRSEH
jgi:G3E family GTPase